MEPKIIEFMTKLNEHQSDGLLVNDPDLKKYERVIPLLSGQVLIQKTFRNAGMVYELTGIGRRHYYGLVNFKGNFKDYDFG